MDSSQAGKAVQGGQFIFNNPVFFQSKWFELSSQNLIRLRRVSSTPSPKLIVQTRLLIITAPITSVQ